MKQDDTTGDAAKDKACNKITLLQAFHLFKSP
jgi:hypothetical protein